MSFDYNQERPTFDSSLNRKSSRPSKAGRITFMLERFEDEIEKEHKKDLVAVEKEERKCF